MAELCQTTRSHVPEHSTLHSHWYESLKSNIIFDEFSKVAFNYSLCPQTFLRCTSPYFFTIQNELSDAGVCPLHILNDMWIFRYSAKKTAERLSIAKKAGVATIKPWMLRCSNKIFSNLLQRAVVKKELLGEGSVVEYLSQQLQCDTEIVEYLNSKYPSIIRIQVSKLKEVFDFVYAEGYTPQHVLQVPRILFHSIETTKSRLLELKGLGYKPHTLLVLCKSKRQYQQFVEQVKVKKNQQCN